MTPPLLSSAPLVNAASAVWVTAGWRLDLDGLTLMWMLRHLLQP